MRFKRAMLTPEKVVLHTLILFSVVLFTYWGFLTQNPFIIVAIGLIPIGLMFASRVTLVLMLTLFLANSRMRIPALPGNLQLFHLVGIVFIIVCAATMVIRRQLFHLNRGILWILVAFTAVLGITILARGIGFAFLGDTKIGGARYISILVALGVLVFSANINFEEKTWYRILLLFFVSMFLPALLEFFTLVTGGAIMWPYLFFDVDGGTVQNFRIGMEGGEMRYQLMAKAGTALILMGFLVFRPKLKTLPILLILVLIGFAINGLSGHRLAFVRNVMFVWLTLGFFFRKHWLPFLATTTAAGILGLLLAILLMPYMPYTFQRMLSWLPFANVDIDVAIDAGGTLDWRLGVWKEALRQIPEFFWVGRGYAFHESALSWMSYLGQGEYTAMWAVHQVAYHNGPLSLLIGMGIFGFLAGFAFMFYSGIRHVMFMFKDWESDFLQKLHAILTIHFLVIMLSFCLFYGDTFVSFPEFFLVVLLLEGLKRCDVRQQIAMAEPVEEAERVGPRFRPNDAEKMVASSG